jgi:hypothetical protein
MFFTAFVIGDLIAGLAAVLATARQRGVDQIMD